MALSRGEIEIGLAKVINDKMTSDYECKIDDSVIKETFFIKSYDNGNSYNLYRGCDLVVGDVPLHYLISTIVGIHENLTSEVRKVDIGKWGGRADVFVIKSLNLVPEGSRYVCSTDSGDLDIYETDQGVVYGVRV